MKSKKKSKNFGHGRTLKSAIRHAIFANLKGKSENTKFTYLKRSLVFIDYLTKNTIKDAQDINEEVYLGFAKYVAKKIRRESRSNAYGQNLISTANIVMQALRLDQRIWLSPSIIVGKRSNTAKSPPTALNECKVQGVIDILTQQGHQVDVLLIKLDLVTGMRISELAQQDYRRSLKEAKYSNYFNIREGTKGGQGKHIDRPVFASSETIGLLFQLSIIQGDKKSIIPTSRTAQKFTRSLYERLRKASKLVGLTSGYRDFRKTFACKYYIQLTSCLPPIMNLTNNSSKADKVADARARLSLAKCLGHHRTNITNSYIGGQK